MENDHKMHPKGPANKANAFHVGQHGDSGAQLAPPPFQLAVNRYPRTVQRKVTVDGNDQDLGGVEKLLGKPVASLDPNIQDALVWMLKGSHNWSYTSADVLQLAKDAEEISKLALVLDPGKKDWHRAIEAAALEIGRKSHSLGRHGPHIDEKDLVGRLTTGHLKGEFAPAGSEGYATSFGSPEAYLATQRAAQQTIVIAYQNTFKLLDDEAQKYNNDWDTLNQKTEGKEFGDSMKNATKFYLDVQKKLDFSTAPLAFLPIPKLPKGKMNPPKSKNEALSRIKLDEKYSFVLKHADTIGKGYKVARDQLDKNVGTVKNPKWAKGKEDPVWDAGQLEPIPALNGTKTTFNPPNDNLAPQDPTTWEMPQHFPDNGEEGWRR